MFLPENWLNLIIKNPVMKTKILSALVCLIFLGAKSQDLHFLNNNQSLLLLNPSFAGSNNAWRIQSTSANIYPNLISSQQSNYLGVDAMIKPIKGAVSLSFVGNNFHRGLLKEQFIHLAYAQHFTLGDKKLKLIPSFQIAYMQRQLDLNSLTFGGPYYPVQFNSQLNNSKANLDFSSGLLAQYKNFYGGISVMHITQPDIGINGKSNLPSSFNVHSVYSIKYSEKLMMQYFALYNQQASYKALLLQINTLLYSHLVFGVGTDTHDQSMLSAGYRNNYISTLLSFGFNWSKLARTPYQAINLSLAFKLPKEKDANPNQSFERW